MSEASYLDPKLSEFATPRQVEYLEAVWSTNTREGAAEKLGISPRSLRRGIESIKTSAAKQGFSPDHNMDKTVPPGFGIGRVSTNYDADGQVRQQWVIAKPDVDEQKALMRVAVDAMLEEIKPEKAVPLPKQKTAEELLNCFVITDYHLGMYAWKEETGANWSIEIAEKLLIDWFKYAVSKAPKAKTAIFTQLGDFLHWDGMLAITPENGNILDADSRLQLVVRTAIRVLRRAISILLQTHEHVHLIMAEGNHDPSGSIHFREWFNALYENEPRVTVELSPQPYYSYEHGLTSLFFHHGHKRKINNIDDVFVAKFRELFGRTKYSYAHMGHLHKNQVLPTNLMQVEIHETLAAPDAYAARGGWMSGRSAKTITYHKRYGEVGRLSITPEMVG